MATIEAVLIGDEKAQRDITQSFVRDQVKDEKVDVVANSSLIPMFETTKVTRLSADEELDIKRKAIEQCGGAADAGCVNTTTDRMRQAKLDEKRHASESSANLVKGRRMTVYYMDEYGERHTMVVPEGQKFQLENVNGGKPKKEATSILSSIPEIQLPTVSQTTMKILSILGVIGMSFVYAFSIAATYRTLAMDYSRMVAIGGTVAAVVFPYSGLFIMFGYFLIREVYTNPVEAVEPRFLAWVIAIALGVAYFSTAAIVALFTQFKDWIIGVFQPTKK
jgi:hypothetical protein